PRPILPPALPPHITNPLKHHANPTPSTWHPPCMTLPDRLCAKRVRRPVTNPIAIAPKPAQSTGQPAGKIALGADPAPDFAGMIALGDAPPSAPARLIGAPAPTTAPVTAAPSALSAALAALLHKPVALTHNPAA